MQRLLIADGSEAFTSALANAFEGEFDLCICHDGETALELLSSFQPDILILQLMLPFKDGLTVLQEASYTPPIILALTTYNSPYIEQRAFSLGVSYIMIMPRISAVQVRLMDLIKEAEGVHCPEYSPTAVALHLHSMNFSPHLDGYQQLCIGVPLFCKDPNQRLSKELYPAIAAACGCKDHRSIEHSIRKSIEAAWKKRDNTVWAKYFPPDPKGHIPCPSNKAFISRLAQLLNM